ncbi:HAD family phosphatase, partial [Candidatus Saccharibacteria bacterium]|nr:HAD family phosphatase [Candidatus Saccharibacteria bacterium]
MKNLSEWTPATDPNFKGKNILAFDLDDTLTENLEINLESLNLLARAQEEGIKTVLVTGRPFGWADALVRLLPFSAAIAENGAIVFDKPDGSSENVDCWYWSASAGYSKDKLPQEKMGELHSLRTEVMKMFPRVQIASDQASRIYDVAFDFAERVHPKMGFKEAQEIADFCETRGFTAKVSNIHVNVWRGMFSKREALEFLVESLWQKSLVQNVVYVGDSPNDAPLFSAVETSVGVSNIQAFVEEGLNFPMPKFVTTKTFGEGA